jgi:hypothetical protein
MGADNVVELAIRRGERAVEVAAGADNEAALLSFGTQPGEDGLHLEGAQDGRVIAHFRSEAARLVRAGEAPQGSLILRGRISQSSYPGGFYRYAVAVGERQFMVDDPRRIGAGEPVGVCLPAAALHLYPA